MIAGIGASGFVDALYPQYLTNRVQRVQRVESQQNAATVQKTQKNSECQTCKERTYVDGSNDPNVSFKTPGHISPSASMSVVSAHEQEHVSQAKATGSKEGNRLVSASVTLQMGICPECGRSYVAGGTTKTAIQYNEQNPYEKMQKNLEASFLIGQNLDLTA